MTDSSDPTSAAVPGSGPEPALPVHEVPSTDGHPVVVYTLLRFLLVALVGAVLYLVGVRGIWLIIFAFLVSGVISMVVLNRRREVAAVGVTTAIQRVNARIDATSRAEDDLADDGLPPDAVTAAGDPPSPAEPAAATPSAGAVTGAVQDDEDDDLAQYEPVDDPRPDDADDPRRA